jgi:hypothetical protein
MRKCGLLSVFVIGLFAGQGLASTTFTLDKNTALLLHQVSVSSSDAGSLLWVTDNPIMYGEAMQGTVGYAGWLWDLGDSDSLASMKIGAMGTAALSSIQTAGSYTGFKLFLANDDDDPWAVQLYTDAGSTSYFSGFTTLPAGTSSTLILNFGTPINFAQVTDIGFEVRGDFSSGKPSNPDVFHISAVPQLIPAPGALLLTLIGIGTIRLGRRNLA